MDFSAQVLQVKQAFVAKNLKLKIAESFTGGGVASQICLIDGASQYLVESIVAYTPISKIARLNVGQDTIDKYQTVSLNCVNEMLDGLINSGNCDVALATSGNASESNEIHSKKGDCYIGIATKTQKFIYYCNFVGTRKQIIDSGIRFALASLTQLLCKI